jgi:hypothetical protein
MRGVDHIARCHDALIGGNPAGLAVFDRARPGSFDHLPTIAAYRVREPEQVLHGLN